MERKFAELRKFFDTSQEKGITLTFNQIEELINNPLCASARKYHAYWYPSQTHTITRCWVENGYRTAQVDLGAETITFEKEVYHAPDK